MVENSTSKSAIYYSDDFLEHKAPIGHPENENRLVSIINKLKVVDFLSIPVIEPREATEDELKLAHTKEHIDIVKKACLSGINIDPDTYTSAGSYKAALKAAGSLIQAAKYIESYKFNRVFCLVRPPGHHATSARAMGFCLFNNAAIAASYLSNRNQKVAILDFDAHHGNGTQDIFYANDKVLYASWHQWPHYPGTGWLDEMGEDDGEGYNINIPLPSQSTDADLICSLDEIIVPVLNKFEPSVIIISAGYDSHTNDPLSNLMFTETGYAAFFKKIVDFSAQNNIGIISCLEGGYDLDALSSSVLKCLEIYSDTYADEVMFDKPYSGEIINEVKHQVGKYWKV